VLHQLLRRFEIVLEEQMPIKSMPLCLHVYYLVPEYNVHHLPGSCAIYQLARKAITNRTIANHSLSGIHPKYKILHKMDV
jgi:hypothetical protein